MNTDKKEQQRKTLRLASKAQEGGGRSHIISVHLLIVPESQAGSDSTSGWNNIFESILETRNPGRRNGIASKLKQRVTLNKIL